MKIRSFFSIVFLAVIFNSQSSWALDFCSDPFKYSCEPAFANNDYTKLKTEMKDLVKEARLQSLNSMGFKDANSAFTDFLKSKGLSVRANLPPADRNNLANVNGISYEDVPKYFEPFATCVSATKPLLEARYSKTSWK